MKVRGNYFAYVREGIVRVYYLLRLDKDESQHEKYDHNCGKNAELSPEFVMALIGKIYASAIHIQTEALVPHILMNLEYSVFLRRFKFPGLDELRICTLQFPEHN